MKCLIIRFSSIGDIVLTSPVMRCLKQQIGAEIHFITKAAYKELVETNPYVDAVFSIKKDIKEVVPLLREVNYDLVIDLHKNLRSQKLKWALGKPSTSFNKLNIEKWLLVHFGVNRLPKRHIVHRYMEAVAHLGVRYDGAGLDFFIEKKDTVDVQKLGVMAQHFTVFAIGATHATKRLPPDKLLEFCEVVETPLVLVGGPSDRQNADFIIENAKKTDIFNACGQFSILQSASIVAQAAKVISHDTGMMHIAAAFRKPITSIWGSTVPAFGMYPFYPDGMERNTTLEVQDLPCRPCSKLGFEQCPKGHFRCMELQKPH